MPKVKSLVILVLLAAGIIFLVGRCSQEEYPRPTDAYYLNDFADALSGAAELYIVNEGEELYADTEDLEDGGAQIVVATFLLEAGETPADYDRTELFRQWKIGKNDMGILLMLLYEESETGPILVEAQIEAGYHVEGYPFAYDLNQYLDDADLFAPDLGAFETEKRIMEVYFRILEGVYHDVYNTNLIWDLDDYDVDYEVYYSDSMYDADVPMNFFLSLLSPYADLGSILGYLLVGIVCFGVAGGFVKNLGGGGSSGGFGFRRRR